MPTPPTVEPLTFQAGDTFTFTKSLPDYPATDWTLTYNLRGQQSIDITATQSGTSNDFLISVASSTTAAWATGLYSVAGYVSALSSRFQIYGGALTITANLATAAGNFDNRTNAEKIVSALESVALSRASREEISYVNGLGISVQKMSHQEIIAALNYWKGVVANEKANVAISQGRGTGRRILTRFVGE